MDTNKVTKRIKVLNYLTIAVTIAMYVLYRITSSVAQTIKTYEELEKLVGYEYIGRAVVGVVALVVIVMTIITMVKSEEKVKGAVPLLIAAIVALVFAIIGMMLGIIIWVLCAASLMATKQKKNETTFEAKLQVEINSDSDEAEAAEVVETVEATEVETAETTSEDSQM